MANTPVELSDVTPLLQKFYDNDPQEVIWGMGQSDPYRSLCDMDSNGMGESYNFEVYSEGTTVASPDYDLAGGAIAAYRFAVTPKTIHFRATVTRESVDSAKMKGSKVLTQVLKRQLDVGVKVALRKLDHHLASKNAAIGTASSEVGSTITLDDKSMTHKLRKGMILVGATANGTGNLFDGELTVASWDDDTGIVTFVEDVGTENFTMPCTLWEKGDVYSDQAKRRSIFGAFDWFGVTAASSSEDYAGVDRSDDPETLQPGRGDYDGVPRRAALIRAAQRNAAKGRKITKCFVGETAYASLREEADAREIVVVNTEKKGGKGNTITIAFESIQLPNGKGGVMDVECWPIMPSDVFLMLADEAEPKIVYTDQLVRLHTDGQDLWRRVEGGVTDSVTGEKVPALRAEGSLRLNHIVKSPAQAFVGTSFNGA